MTRACAHPHPHSWYLQLELRSLSLLFGESLEGLSLASTNVDVEALRMVSIRFFHLRSMNLSNCPEVRTARPARLCMRLSA